MFWMFQKLYKKHYDPRVMRIPGTLSYYRNIIRNTNISGFETVKTRFDACEDFLITVTEAMILSLAQETLGNLKRFFFL